MAGKAEVFKRLTLVTLLTWSLLLLGLLLYLQHLDHQQVLNLAKSEAETAFDKDVVYRRWNAMHGGVYVPVTEKTPPNPLLAAIPERDLTTPSGRRLTLVNPAYMTRQVHEITSSALGILGHITSLKPIRPANTPDQWETQALRAFESGAAEFVSLEYIGAHEYLRFMRPLVTETPCLRCHADQGYREGDIRGGISVAIPMQEFRATERLMLRHKMAGFGLIWLVGLAGLLVGSRQLSQKSSRIQEEEKLTRQYSKDLEKLLAISHDTTITTDQQSLYRSFVFASKELLCLDFSSLMLLSEDKSRLTIHDCLGFPEAMIGTFHLVEGQGLSTLVVKNKTPAIVADFASETRFAVPPIVREKQIQAAIAVPMLMKEEIIGVLIGHTLERREFTRKDIDVYQHVANQAAVAIRNLTNMNRLRQSEKMTREIIASLGEGLYALDDAGRITLMNPEAERLLGWREAELIGRDIHELVHSRRADGVYLPAEECPIRKVIMTGERFVSKDEVFTSKAGLTFPVSLISAPILVDGKVEASITAFQDISAQKGNEREREQLISELQTALAELKTLRGILPICSHCKKIRDTKGAWTKIETYISRHSEAQFSHGICADCLAKHYPEYCQKEE